MSTSCLFNDYKKSTQTNYITFAKEDRLLAIQSTLMINLCNADIEHVKFIGALVQSGKTNGPRKKEIVKFFRKFTLLLVKLLQQILQISATTYTL